MLEVTSSAAGRVAESAAQVVESHLQPAALSSAVVEIVLDGSARVARLARSPEDIAIGPTMVEELNDVLTPLSDADEEDRISSVVVILIDGSCIRTDIRYRRH